MQKRLQPEVKPDPIEPARPSRGPTVGLGFRPGLAGQDEIKRPPHGFAARLATVPKVADKVRIIEGQSSERAFSHACLGAVRLNGREKVRDVCDGVHAGSVGYFLTFGNRIFPRGITSQR